jgi:hypothetical protein
MGKYTSSSSFLLIKLPRPPGTFILLPSLLHRPSQAPPPTNLPVKMGKEPHCSLLELYFFQKGYFLLSTLRSMTAYVTPGRKAAHYRF